MTAATPIAWLGAATAGFRSPCRESRSKLPLQPHFSHRVDGLGGSVVGGRVPIYVTDTPLYASNSSAPRLGACALFLAFTGCASTDKSETGSGADSADTGATSGIAPTVSASSPADAAVDQALNQSVSATFSLPMDPGSLSQATFSLSSCDPPVALAGTVITAGAVSTFWPAAPLDANTEYTAQIGTGARSLDGVALAADHAWRFSTGARLDPGQPVALGTAADFTVLAKTGISSVPASAITGDIGVSPAAATYITGFSLSADASNAFSTSPQVTGRVYAADYADPTPAKMTTAIGDMERALVDAAGRAPDVTELGAGNVGGMTLAPGVYKWGTGLLIPTDLSLTGSATDVWIFQIAQDLTLSSAARVNLLGGALPQNVFWQVSGMVDLGTTAHLEGVVLVQTSLNLRTGASIRGRLLAQTAVDIDGATVAVP